LLLKLRDRPNATNFGRGKDYLVAGLHGVEHEAVLDFEFVRGAGGVRTYSTCVYRKLKPGRNGDEARRVSGVNE
jgi:hypothetical protein